MLKNCGGGPRPIRLCVEKTSNFDEIQQRRSGPVSKNLPKF